MDGARPLPHDLEAERSVLGAILIENNTYTIAAEIIQSADFFRRAHKLVFDCIGGVLADGRAVDFVILAESLERNGLLDEVGGPAYLGSLTDGVPRSTNVEAYAKIVKEKARQRKNIALGLQLQASAWNEELPAAEIAQTAINGLAVIGSDHGSGRHAVLVNMNDVRPEAIHWLWPGRLAFGKLTILSGDPGLGKSFITMDLAARASAGRTWPDRARALDPCNVLLLSAEDGLADTLRPRLDALGADVARVNVITAIKAGTTERGPQLVDVAEIERAIVETQSRLLVIDPVSSYLGSADSHKDSEVRGVLTPLIQMAERHNCAVLGVMHLTKDAGKNAKYRTSGSVAFIAQARIGLMVAEDPENPERRVLGVSKINIEKAPACLAYTLDGGRLEWASEPLTDFDLGAALAASGAAGRDKGEQTDAEQIIRELLADHSVWPLDAKDAKTQGEGHGIHERTMQRTARRLGIRITRTGFGPGGRWVWNRPLAIGDTIDDNRLDTEPMSSMSSMQNPAGIPAHTHIDDSSTAFPRARETRITEGGKAHVEL